MEIPLIRLSPENLITVAILSGGAYLGVIGAQKVVGLIKSRAK